MKKFTKSLATLAVCSILSFGFGFDKVEAAENFDESITADITEDFDLNSTDDKVALAPPPPRYGPHPPPRYGPPPPPKYGPPPPPPSRHRPNPLPPPKYGPPPPPPKYGPPPHHGPGGGPPPPHHHRW